MSKNNNTIRNLRAFLTAYLSSESGKAALRRSPTFTREGKKTTPVWRSSAMAQAFKQALIKGAK